MAGAGRERVRGVLAALLLGMLCMAGQPAFAQNSAEAGAKPADPPAPATDKEVSDSADEQAGNAAESTAPTSTKTAAEDQVGKDAAQTGDSAAATAAEKAAPTSGSKSGKAAGAGAGAKPDTAPPAALPPPPSANSAEQRAGGSSRPNTAEGWDTVAEPPLPDIKLPTPQEVAGPSQGYRPPEIRLNVPGIDRLPGTDPLDAFTRPERLYLEQRPLPGLDETETDEERIARNIEESLRQLDLGKETRPEQAVKLPLSGGQVLFRAADSFSYDRKRRVLTFTGNAEIFFGSQLVAADFIEVNDGAASAYAKGYVMLSQADEVLYCDEAYINYDTLQLELFYVDGNTGGTRLSNGVVYFQAQRAHGSWDNLILDKVEVTTCDPFCGEVDEVHLSAKKAVYKRGKSIVLHSIHPYVRSHKVGWIPMLAFPLLRDQQRPEQPNPSDIDQNYGFNAQDGWFAKFGYTYWTRYVERANTTLYGKAYAEIVQNRGVGLGVKQDFYIPALGVTSTYGFYQREWPASFRDNWLGRNPRWVSGDENFEFSLLQELNISRKLTGKLESSRLNTVRPSGLQSGSFTRNDDWTSRFNMRYQEGHTDATLNASHSIRSSGGRYADGTTVPAQESTNSSASFNLNQKLSNEFKFTLDQNYTANKGSSGTSGIPADQEGNFGMGLDFTGKPKSPLEGYNFRLSYRENGIDYDQDRNTRDNNMQVNKELPKLEITFPQNLVNDGAYFNRYRLIFANLVSGRRRAPQSSFKAQMTIDGGDSIEFSRAARLNSSTTFNQYWYDDGNAQYALGQTTSFSYQPKGAVWDFGINHRLNYRQGVKEPPVSTDRTTYSQNLSATVGATNHRSWKAQLSGGYNFALARWDPLSIRYNWDPNRTFSAYFNSGYNWEGHDWGISTIQATLRSPHIDERGVYNWLFNFNVDSDTNYWDRWSMTRLQYTYFRRYERGWSAEVHGGFRQGGRGDEPPDLQSWRGTEDFLRNVVKGVTIRKVNCCTTIEASWSAPQHEYMLRFYLNALPQYPGSTYIDRLQKTRDPVTNAALDRYLYKPQYIFPFDAVQRDFLQDVFGIQNSYGGLGGF